LFTFEKRNDDTHSESQNNGHRHWSHSCIPGLKKTYLNGGGDVELFVVKEPSDRGNEQVQVVGKARAERLEHAQNEHHPVVEHWRQAGLPLHPRAFAHC
jgi:hypothetical protein